MGMHVCRTWYGVSEGAPGTTCTSKNVLGEVDSGILPKRLEASSARYIWAHTILVCR